MKTYEERVQELENEGHTTSDAQGIADVEFKHVGMLTDEEVLNAALDNLKAAAFKLSALRKKAGHKRNWALAAELGDFEKQINDVINYRDRSGFAGFVQYFKRLHGGGK